MAVVQKRPLTGRANASAIERLFEAKARAELRAADESLGCAVEIDGAGTPLADTLLVKGDRDEADLAAGRVAAGADGEAMEKALVALQLDPAAVRTTHSRPNAEAGARLRAARLALVVEAVDPRVVIALDPAATEDLSAAFGIPSLESGMPVRCRGRVLGAVDGFARSLDSAQDKRRVWEQLKKIVAAIRP